MSESPPPPAPVVRDVNWTRRLVFIGIAIVAAILSYLIGGAVLPRWWAHQIGDQVNESSVMGVLVGLFYGIVFTFLPLLVLYLGFRQRRTIKMWGAFVVGALALAIPNLLTVGIVVGNGNAAHAGERILDTEASYFRGATAVGAVVGLLLFGFASWILIRRHRLRDRERQVKADRKALERERDNGSGQGSGTGS